MKGFLFIGDPHLWHRKPAGRRDHYGQTVLNKLKQCMEIANTRNLQPILLGDLFHTPRDHSNALLGKLINLFKAHPPWAIYGNHDISAQNLSDADTFDLLVKAQIIELLNPKTVKIIEIQGHLVKVGGSSYRQKMPKSFKKKNNETVIWITHKNLRFDSFDSKVKKKTDELVEIPGIDYVINGHLHSIVKEVQVGQTRWINPGNISRVSRKLSVLNHLPRVLSMERIDDQWTWHWHELQHQHWTEIFEEDDEQTPFVSSEQKSSFIEGLENLNRMRTDDGTGFVQFMKQYIEREVQSEDVAQLIRDLAGKLLPKNHPWHQQ